MYNYILSAGLKVVANGNFNHKVDIESNEGRQLVYSGLRAWQRDVFSARDNGLISSAEKVQVFSEIKTIAVDNYNIAREELTNNIVKETIVVVDEVAVLKAKIADLEADNSNLKASDDAKAVEIKNLKTEVTETKRSLVVADSIINNLRSKKLVEVVSRTKVVDKVITKVQELISVKF